MDPIKVIIVDDDKIIIRDLLRMIDWEQNGFHVVATAYNGWLGIDKYKSCKPHIILTDIKMPIMDGIQMIKEIKEIGASVYFIILSAYGEFQYAQQAIKLAAYSYILKEEINADWLLKIMLEIKDQINTHAEAAYHSINNVLQLYISGTQNNLECVLEDMDNAFTLYLIENGEGETSSLSKRLSGLIEKYYSDHDMSNIFVPPKISSKEELRLWLREQLRTIDHWRIEKRKNRYSSNISNAIMYIERNYGDKELNIGLIAEALTISSSWLSIRFKQEVGVTVNDYIRKTRIDRAKLLLRRGEYKVYEVADMVGYGSSQYFSKVFFQETEKQPQHYRGDET